MEDQGRQEPKRRAASLYATDEDAVSRFFRTRRDRQKIKPTEPPRRCRYDRIETIGTKDDGCRSPRTGKSCGGTKPRIKTIHVQHMSAGP